MLKTPLIAAALGLALAAVPAAASNDAPRSVKVEYGDLNLDTVAGQNALDRRIEYAAKTVCAVGEHQTGTRIPSAERKQCYAKARSNAERQVATVVGDVQRGG